MRNLTRGGCPRSGRQLEEEEIKVETADAGRRTPRCRHRHSQTTLTQPQGILKETATTSINKRPSDNAHEPLQGKNRLTPKALVSPPATLPQEGWHAGGHLSTPGRHGRVASRKKRKLHQSNKTHSTRRPPPSASDRFLSRFFPQHTTTLAD